MSKNVRLETSCVNNSRGELIRHLVIDDTIWMSNDDQEYADIDRAIRTAHGCCFVGGLGLGLVVQELLKKPEVTGITVVEINSMVSSIIASRLNCHQIPGKLQWMGNKIDIFTGDATKDFYSIGGYDWMYFDIWLEPNETGLKIWNLCKERAKPYLKKNGTIEGWYKPRLESGNILR